MNDTVSQFQIGTVKMLTYLKVKMLLYLTCTLCKVSQDLSENLQSVQYNFTVQNLHREKVKFAPNRY